MRSYKGLLVTCLISISSCSDQGSNGAVQNSSGGSAGTAGAGSGGSPSNGGTGGGPSMGGAPCGGAIAFTCHTDKNAGFRVAIGTDTQPPNIRLVRVCRNEACATVDISAGVPAPRLLFGPGDREQIRIAIENQAGALMLSVAWVSPATDDSLKDGDIYSLRLLDAAGKTLKLVRQVATYTRYSVTNGGGCYGPGIQTPCLDVTLADAPAEPPDASADATTDGSVTVDGSNAARCCPREPDAPPGALRNDGGADASGSSYVKNPFCFALGGVDLGGCYKTCGWKRSSSTSEICDISARIEVDSSGCETWIADVPDGAPPPLSCDPM